MKFTFAGLLSLAAAAMTSLSKHDSTGVLADPSKSLDDKAKALPGALASAGADIVEQGVASKLGPEAGAVAELAVPLLEQIAEAALSKKEALLAA